MTIPRTKHPERPFPQSRIGEDSRTRHTAQYSTAQSPAPPRNGRASPFALLLGSVPLRCPFSRPASCAGGCPAFAGHPAGGACRFGGSAERAVSFAIGRMGFNCARCVAVRGLPRAVLRSMARAAVFFFPIRGKQPFGVFSSRVTLALGVQLSAGEGIFRRWRGVVAECKVCRSWWIWRGLRCRSGEAGEAAAAATLCAAGARWPRAATRPALRAPNTRTQWRPILHRAARRGWVERAPPFGRRPRGRAHPPPPSGATL